MKTQKNSTGRIIKIVLGGIVLSMAIPFCLGMYAGITSHTGTTGAIAETLKEHCNCEEINLDLSAYGLQFSHRDGLTGQKVAYTLKGCDNENTVDTEAARLNKILNAEVEGYADLDVVQLLFVNEDNIEITEIINGKLQNQ